MTRYDVPAGIDGFYYAVQVRSFAEREAFYYPTHTPLVLYIMGAAAKLGAGVFTAVSGTSVLLHAALTLSLASLATSLNKRRWAGLLAAAVAAGSRVHLIWIGEFLKQLGGVAFFFAGAACLARDPGSRRRRLTALVLVAASALCHKPMAFLLLPLCCLALLFHLLLRIRGSRLAILKIGAVVLVGLCLPAVAAREDVPVSRQISETVLSAPGCRSSAPPSRRNWRSSSWLPSGTPSV